MRPSASLGIAAQLIIPFVVLSVMATVLLGVFNLSTVNTALHAALDTKSAVMTRYLANELIDPLSMGEYDRMQNILMSAQKLDGSFFYAVAVAADGRVLASTDTSVKNLRLDRDAFERSALNINQFVRRPTKFANVFETVTPITGLGGDKGGILRAGFSTDAVDQAIRATFFGSLCIGMLTLIGGIGVYILIIRKSIIQPVGDIALLATRIAEGDLSNTVQSSRNDEIGQLFRAEGEMVRCLREVAHVAELIANGDLTAQVQVRSQRDVFGKSLEKMVASLNESTKEVRQLAAIVEHSDDAIFSIKHSGEIISWNKGAQLLLGFEKQAALATSVQALLLPDDREHFAKLVERVFSGEPVETYETVNVRQDGSSVPIALSVSPVRGEADTVVAVSLIARDITHKRAVEARMREFYSIVSHELRTPLTSIRGALGLLESGTVAAASNEGAELIVIAKSSTERLVRLINDILDLRKIESGELVLDINEVDSTRLANNVVEAMRAMAQERGVTITTDFEYRRSLVVDADRATQVMANLISNAIKYSERGQTVQVSTSPSKQREMIRFTISDQGAGIPEEAHHKLFQMFKQVDSSDTRAKEGSGLGLAISKAIVEQHAGTIGFESVPECGSTFWFELPVPMDILKPHTNLPQIPEREFDGPAFDNNIFNELQAFLDHEGYLYEDALSRASSGSTTVLLRGKKLVTETLNAK